MSDAQQKVLDALRSFIARHGYSPTISELMTATGSKSRNNIHGCLISLRDAGIVTWQNGAYRTLRLVRDEHMGTT